MDANRRADHLSRERARAEQAGRDLSAPISVTHLFFSPGRRPEAVVRALNALGITAIVADKEVTGDGYWHVAAFAPCLLTAPETAGVEVRMEQVAQDTGAEYDGWSVTLTAGEEQRLRR